MTQVSYRQHVDSFDPGLLTGWSRLSCIDGTEIDHGIIPFEVMPQWLISRHADLTVCEAIICEDFQLFGHKAKQQTGSRFETVQVIGMLRLWATHPFVPIHMQPANIKPQAEKLTGRKPEGSHDKSHDIDAFNHGAYWLHAQGRFESVFERKIRERLSDRG